jgi:large subunit ribosomal protein L22
MAETKKKATAEVKEEAKAEKKPAAKKAPAKKAAAPKKEAAPKAAPKAEEKKPAKKKAEVKAEPVKAKVTEAHAIARDVRVTPRKVRLVMDLVRGKSVNEALELLFHVNKAASDPVAKLIKSAAANATNNFGMAGDKLYVAEIQASDGVRMKRFEPRGKGASSPIIKRTSFMRVTVKER